MTALFSNKVEYERSPVHIRVVMNATDQFQDDESFFHSYSDNFEILL